MGGDASCVGSRVNKDDRHFTDPELLVEVLGGLLQDGGPCALERTFFFYRVEYAARQDPCTCEGGCLGWKREAKRHVTKDMFA